MTFAGVTAGSRVHLIVAHADSSNPQPQARTMFVSYRQWKRGHRLLMRVNDWSGTHGQPTSDLSRNGRRGDLWLG